MKPECGAKHKDIDSKSSTGEHLRSNGSLADSPYGTVERSTLNMVNTRYYMLQWHRQRRAEFEQNVPGRTVLRKTVPSILLTG